MSFRVTPLRQWVLSFIVWDVIAYGLLLFSCLFSVLFAADICGGMSAVFIVAHLYPFFWIPVPDIAMLDDTLAGLLAPAGIGAMLHACIGLCIGILTRRKKISWDASLSIAFVAIIVLTAFINIGLAGLGVL